MSGQSGTNAPTAEKKEGKHGACGGIVCSKEPCACPKELRALINRDEAKYTKHDGETETFLRMTIDEGGKKFLGCVLCQTHLGKDGIPGAKGNAKMHKGQMLITKSISIDTVNSHVGKEDKQATEKTSDHKRAVQAHQRAAPEKSIEEKRECAEPAENEPPVMSRRQDMIPSQNLLNTVLALYLVLKKPLASTVFEQIMWLSQHIGASVTKRYTCYWFYKEMLISMNVILWENAIRFVKAQRSIALYWDIGAGYLLIRVGGFDKTWNQVTIFWQARELTNKTASGVYTAIIRAFTTKPMAELGDDPSLQLTELEFFEKLKICCADGASENGVRKRGQMKEWADDLNNVTAKLQKRKDELLGALSSYILCYWCCSHRMDIVSESPEKSVAYIAVVMSWMRSLIGHITASTKAQGLLRWIALLIWNSDGDESLKDAPGALAAVRYAPQRWLSQVTPLSSIVGRINDVWMYLVMMSDEEKKATSDLAENLLKRMEIYVSS
jgi:hypothetical protein